MKGLVRPGRFRLVTLAFGGRRGAIHLLSLYRSLHRKPPTGLAFSMKDMKMVIGLTLKSVEHWSNTGARFKIV